VSCYERLSVDWADQQDDAACIAEIRAEHDADVRRMIGGD